MKQYLVFLLAICLLFSCKTEQKQSVDTSKNTKITGGVFGTTYLVKYNSDEDFSKQFDSLFQVINTSMSTYIPNSIISKLNNNEDVTVDAHFKTVFNASKEIFQETNGVFDPTIGDVVNAWDFGAEQNKFLTDSTTIDSLMQFVGLDKVKIEADKVIKQPGTYLEFNAIAKGYGVDVIGRFLEGKNIGNYLVEIGGEIRVRGKNIDKNAPWLVGVDEPRFDGGHTINKAIALKDKSMATSGTYRKYKIDENGNRYAHIINTKTGYPAKTNILSVSVIAEDCMVADGYATAFQAMGVSGVTEFLVRHPELQAFLIFENDKKELETISMNGFPELITLKPQG